MNVNTSLSSMLAGGNMPQQGDGQFSSQMAVTGSAPSSVTGHHAMNLPSQPMDTSPAISSTSMPSRVSPGSLITGGAGVGGGPVAGGMPVTPGGGMTMPPGQLSSIHGGAPGQMQQSKDGGLANTALLCRVGQETVQEIVSKTSDLFQQLKTLQPPNGMPPSVNAQEERKGKIKESLRNVDLHFKRLRKFYERVNESCAAMEYIQVETLIPMRDDVDSKQQIEEKKTSDFKHLSEEHQELIEQLRLKNQQIKEVIDNLRSIVWEINTMLAMRKP